MCKLLYLHDYVKLFFHFCEEFMLRNLFILKIITDIQHSNSILTQLSDDMQQTFKDVFTNEFVSKSFDSHNAHPVFQYVVNLTFSF